MKPKYFNMNTLDNAMSLRRCQCAVKFPGSGGAVLGLCRSEVAGCEPFLKSLGRERFDG